MARDFEDLHDLDDLSDDELRELVRQHIAADSTLDADEIEVRVAGGHVTLDGRVGTDPERRVADHILSDVLGLTDYENGIFVDPARRPLSPEAIDDTLAVEDAEEGLLLGDRPHPTSPEASHLVEDLDSRLSGSTNVHNAIEDATPWIPPESPTPEGPTGAGEFGEDH